MIFSTLPLPYTPPRYKEEDDAATQEVDLVKRGGSEKKNINLFEQFRASTREATKVRRQGEQLKFFRIAAEGTMGSTFQG